MIGRRFGRLVVLARIDRKRYLCGCHCGNEVIVLNSNLYGGNTRSCGCLYWDTRGVGRLKHGKSHTPIHNIWHNMMQRCYNPRTNNWKDYGGRGIKVCYRWHRFENFYADMGDPPVGLTLDRKDNNKGYSKGNCRWASRSVQSRNRRILPPRERDAVGRFI